ncbi:mucin-2-like [Toxorhynchites rutilus septentrionalis]|uniref:mucin-2-like n=1 Tax=Toxorhynchites rutilus septentrionalis TaxID=329112 RepID=UPI0024797AA8|nr:mucin-2-like [Toxorhynchites rutilus septentrionalis]
MSNHFWWLLILVLVVSFRDAIAEGASCSRIDFNSAELTFLAKCLYYQEFVVKPYANSTVFSSFRENATYYLSHRWQGLTCGETVQTYKINSQTELRMVYNLVFAYGASLQIRVLDLDRLDSENKPTLVERWQTVQSTAGWGLFKERINKTVDRAKIQIEANMNSGSDVAIEYLTIFNYEVETDECNSIDEFATTTPGTTTSTVSSSLGTTTIEATTSPPPIVTTSQTTTTANPSSTTSTMSSSLRTTTIDTTTILSPIATTTQATTMSTITTTTPSTSITTTSTISSSRTTTTAPTPSTTSTSSLGTTTIEATKTPSPIVTTTQGKTTTTTATSVETTTVSRTTSTPATIITEASTTVVPTAPTTITPTQTVITSTLGTTPTTESTATDHKPLTSSTTNVPREESTQTTEPELMTRTVVLTTTMDDASEHSDEPIAAISTADWLWITLAATFAVLLSLAITSVAYICAENKKLHKVKYKMGEVNFSKKCVSVIANKN